MKHGSKGYGMLMFVHGLGGLDQGLDGLDLGLDSLDYSLCGLDGLNILIALMA